LFFFFLRSLEFIHNLFHRRNLLNYEEFFGVVKQYNSFLYLLHTQLMYEALKIWLSSFGVLEYSIKK